MKSNLLNILQSELPYPGITLEKRVGGIGVIYNGTSTMTSFISDEKQIPVLKRIIEKDQSHALKNQ